MYLLHVIMSCHGNQMYLLHVIMSCHGNQMYLLQVIASCHDNQMYLLHVSITEFFILSGIMSSLSLRLSPRVR